MKLSGHELLHPPGWTGRSIRVFVVRLSILKWEIMKLWEVALGKLRTLCDSGIGLADMCILWTLLEEAFQVGNLSWGKVFVVPGVGFQGHNSCTGVLKLLGKFQQCQLGLGMAEGVGNAQQGQEMWKSICYVVNDTNNLEFLQPKPFSKEQDPPFKGEFKSEIWELAALLSKILLKRVKIRDLRIWTMYCRY